MKSPFVMIAGLLLMLVSAAAAQTPDIPKGKFHNCNLRGTAKKASVGDLNVLKNRAVDPWHINPAITAAALFAPGDDTDRFSVDDGATIRVFVKDVKPGGTETVNCGHQPTPFLDTHIEVLRSATDTSLPMIVEVTPRWRKGMAAAGEDWSTKALKSTLKGHIVEFTGWMFRDDEHTQNSFNINPTKLGKKCGKAPCLWRATVWELHPVTAIKLIQ